MYDEPMPRFTYRDRLPRPDDPDLKLIGIYRISHRKKWLAFPGPGPLCLLPRNAGARSTIHDCHHP